MTPIPPMSPYSVDKRKSMKPPSSLYNGTSLTNINDNIDQTDLSTIQSSSSGFTMSSNLYIEPEYNVKLVLNFNAKEIQLIRSTWNQMINDDLSKNLTENTQASAVNHASIASSLFCIQFYSNLLNMDPHLETMFPSIKHQAISFAGVLSTAIIQLENLKQLDDYLQNLGKRHSRILGIDPPHFELMGVALLKTFQDRFGIHFTLELERCWARLYTYLANSILQFGIDPVLKIDKINSEWNQVQSGYLSGGNRNSSMVPPLERSMTELTNSSTFDSRSSVHTNSSINQTTKLRQPSNVSSLGTSIKHQSTMQSLNSGANRLGKKVIRKQSQTMDSSLTTGSDEEKCVIM